MSANAKQHWPPGLSPMQSEAVPSSRAAYSDRTSALMALFCELAYDGKLSLESARNTFRDPSFFTGHIDESSFTSFTGTQKNRRFFDLVERFSGQEPGRNGITSLPESCWSLTFILNHQPYYQNQPAGVYVFYGLGRYADKIGDYTHKPMGECSGREILKELVRHLGFDADLNQSLDSSNVIPCRMPFVTSQFLKRKVTDRPDVVPKAQPTSP